MAAGAAVAGTAIAGFVIFIILLWFAIIVGIILLIIFWIFMIIDAAQREFKNDTDKVVWILVIVLASWIGAIIYYFVIKKPDKH